MVCSETPNQKKKINVKKHFDKIQRLKTRHENHYGFAEIYILGML